MASKNWVWDTKSLRYRYPSGRLVPPKYVKNDIFRLSKGVRDDLRDLTKLLDNGTISQGEWYRRMKAEIRAAYRATIVAAEGGFSQMTPSKWGRFGAVMKAEYKFLDGFLRDIKSGKWRGKRAVARAGRYGNSISRIYESWRLQMHRALGFSEARRVLSVAEHCHTEAGLEGCVELAARGWVSIDQIVEIGETPCDGGCKCSIEYQNQVTVGNL